ncbi:MULTISPECIES: HGxxPAAW family protein [unclassified Streptomyces]|uniref:HGxxPAAW family protein n=1 Tax=unclassified Streptomyces TaxID=2593676 RepID=UPI002E30AF7A|nr:HGxxPAAW family protein [Streptomyces sp. NBC_01477]
MAAHHDHGHTPAAWTGVIIAFVGFCAGGVFMVAAQPVPFWGSMGVILLAPLVGGIMKMMGLGRKEEPQVRNAPARTAEQPPADQPQGEAAAHA